MKRKQADAREVRIVKLPVRVKPVVRVEATARKRTFSRTDLPEGDFMMNYYYRMDDRGELIPEDVDFATHFERVVYDRHGNTI